MPSKRAVVTGPKFPVETTTGTITYQVRDGRSWKDVTEVTPEVARKTIAVLNGLKRRQGRDYRFTVTR